MAAQSAYAQPDVPPGFEDSFVASVAWPTAVAFTPDGRILLTSQLGQLYVYQNGALVSTPALDLGSTSCAYRERGLLGVAVDPQFASNHFIYVTYTFNKHGNCDAEYSQTPVGRVARFQLGDDNIINPATERVLIDNIPSIIGVHNTDDVKFGKDGYLYVTVGDSGCDYANDSGCFDSNNAARDLHALVGKILRITSDGGIPPDNPFTGPGSVRCNVNGGTTPGNTCQEIFATGLRNPWRIAFDPNAAGTRFFINDVGQDTWEEIDEGQAGADYGWNMREGFCATGSTTDCSTTPLAGLTNPIYAYGRSDGCSSVTGGAFVPNGAWSADLDGIYLFSDFVCGGIFKLLQNADGTYRREPFMLGLGGATAVDMQFGPHGGETALYYATFARGGELRRLSFVGAANRSPSAAFTAAPLFGPTPLTVDFDGSASTDPDGDVLTYSWDFGDGTPGATGAMAQHTYSTAGAYFATLRVRDPDGAESTATERIDVGNTPPQPTILSPASAYRFAVGDTIVLQGRANDAEDGALPDSALTWRVVRRHNTHTHPFLPPTAGNNVSFPAPGPENIDAGGTSYLEIELTAVDSRGRTATVTQVLMPRTVRMDFLSQPSGAMLVIDNAVMTTPASLTSWVNYGLAVEARGQTYTDGSTLTFESWSDGGAAAHTIVSPETDATYTARFTASAPAASTPYNGTPASIPGVIQAENFDEGGVGVAYSDTSPENSGGQHRQTGVDVEATADVSGVFNVGWAFAGEWLNYTVNVAGSGSYDLEFRVASNGPGGTFHLNVNGVDATGPLTVPDTGGWQTWTTIRRTGVSLAAGQQVWRLVMDTNGSTTAVGNFNEIRVNAASGQIPATPVPGTIEAENFDDGGPGVGYSDTTPENSGSQYRSTGVDIEATADTGGGYNVGWMFAGEWLRYTVNVATAGIYDLEFRVASNGSGGTFHVEVDGADKTGPLSVPNTAGWQAWTTIRADGINLNAGVQQWRVVMDTNGATTAVGNLNWIRVSSRSSNGAIVRGPYLQQVTDRSAILVWTTREPAAGEVRYGGPDGMTLVTAAEMRPFSSTQTGLDFDFYQHEAHLAGLSAATRYTYDIFADGVDSTAGQDAFTTAPATGGGTVRFIAFGDSGVGSTAQNQLAGRMAAETFDFALHAGDIAYGTANAEGGGSYRQYDDWLFSVYAAWLRTHALFPSIGNHDDEVDFARAYRDVFVLPEHGATATYPDHAERYYSFDYGPVHFVALDTERAFIDPARRQAQLTWLDADLGATPQPWRVVFFHRSPYSSGAEHGSELAVRQAFGPVFERRGVQLVISSHEHDYERSVPWREFVPSGGSVTYIVTGGGGAPLYQSGMNAWTATSASVHHYVRATVGGCAIQLDAVGLDGAVFDTYSLNRCTQATDGAAPQVAITSPSNGAAVSGVVDVQASASDDVSVAKVDLYVDGVLTAIDSLAPYSWGVDTTAFTNGTHVLEARAYDNASHNTRSASVSVSVSNGAPTARDVVLYSSDVSVIQGNWSRVASSSGAGGFRMSSADLSAPAADPAITPVDYFEATFNAPAGSYRIWLRMRGTADSKFNESVWVQLSDATTGAGAPLWRIGTTNALLVNLEDCGGCGISSWGWQDNAWWLGESSVVRFTTAGPHTIRIQTREDGVDIDQIVLSPVTFFTNPPGPVRNDQTIVPK